MADGKYIDSSIFDNQQDSLDLDSQTHFHHKTKKAVIKMETYESSSSYVVQNTQEPRTKVSPCHNVVVMYVKHTLSDDNVRDAETFFNFIRKDANQQQHEIYNTCITALESAFSNATNLLKLNRLTPKAALACFTSSVLGIVDPYATIILEMESFIFAADKHNVLHKIKPQPFKPSPGSSPVNHQIATTTLQCPIGKHVGIHEEYMTGQVLFELYESVLAGRNPENTHLFYSHEGNPIDRYTSLPQVNFFLHLVFFFFLLSSRFSTEFIFHTSSSLKLLFFAQGCGHSTLILIGTNAGIRMMDRVASSPMMKKSFKP